MPITVLPARRSAPRPIPFASSPLAIASDGGIAGYASLFDVPDMGGDIVARGAFADSLARRPARDVRMLFQHDPKEPVGIWTTMVEDARGLYVEGRLTLDNSRARDLEALIRDRAIDGLSIGFKTVTGARNPRSGMRRLSKLDLWEISIVTFPMLPGARLSPAVKASCPRLLARGDTRRIASSGPAAPSRLASLAAAIRASTRKT
jgi:hypothetical protein